MAAYKYGLPLVTIDNAFKHHTSVKVAETAAIPGILDGTGRLRPLRCPLRLRGRQLSA